MSGVRSLHRGKNVKGYATAGSAPIYVNSTGNSINVIPAGSGTTEVSLLSTTDASGTRVTGGVGTFVSGSVTIQTGLSAVTSFVAQLEGSTGFATGATEITDVIVASVTTGAVACTGLRLETTTLSASGTGTFYWLAFGTP